MAFGMVCVLCILQCMHAASSSVVDLKEALLASGDSQCSRRQQLGTCSLVRHLSLNGLSRKSLNVYLLPNQDLKGVVCKKGK